MMSSAFPVLYSFRRCPYAMRARVALVASAQVCELREVVLSKKPEALLMASAKGTVPVLVTPMGQVVDQSLDIMHWALRRNDPLQWLGDGDSSTAQMLQLVEQCDGEFKFHLDRYKYPDRYALSDAANHRELGALYIADLNRRLTKHEFLMGPSQCLADMAIAPFIRQFAHTDPAWFASQPWRALQSWLTAFERSNLFEQVMQKFPGWMPGQPAVLFPMPTAALSPEHVRA
jgi:glutathione S-transferase